MMGGDFDINLIKEYAKRPGLYDRNSPYYKDRMYITQSWLEISQKLGFEVRLLKERMIQLRNRYNMEKRRLDSIKSKYPNRIVRSQWPLYMHMDFMNGHIKHRRSFSKMTTRQYRPMSFEGDIRSQTPPPMTQIHNSINRMPKSLSNGDVEVKCENTVDLDEDPPSLMNMDNDNDNENFVDDEIDGSVAKGSSKQEYMLRPQVTITQPDLDGIRIRNSRNLHDDHSFRVYDNAQFVGGVTDVKEKKRMIRLHKYETFGKFLAMSLCDMPETKAMKLVEKFTSDLVRSVLSTDDDIVAAPSTSTAATTARDLRNNTEGNDNSEIQIKNVESVSQEQIKNENSNHHLNNDGIDHDDDDDDAIDNNVTDEHTDTRHTTNNMDDGGEEYDQLIYDLTEDEPSSV